MKFLLTLMITALLATTTAAQDKMGSTNGSKSRSEMMAERMTKDLGLNADQSAKVQAITLIYDKKATGTPSAISTKEIAPDPSGALTEMRGSLKTVLTPAQFEQWQKIQSGEYVTNPEGRTINEVKRTE